MLKYGLSLAIILLYMSSCSMIRGMDTGSCSHTEMCSFTDSPTKLDHREGWTNAVVMKPAPYWKGTAVVDGNIKEIKLTDYRGKYLVFFFYPLDFTFVCPTEVLALNEKIDEFHKIGAEVVGVSVDSHFTHRAWINSLKKDNRLDKLKIPLLSDLTHEISRDYGVYLEDKGHSLRGLFIIDREGIVRQITLNDLPVGRSVEETLRLVRAFQYTDEHGEACPSGWQPGQRTISNREEDEKEEL
ncbi:peroxiredoxin-2-like isoform X2 [Diaphorina citri]|uniref:thioredoxin-dependent peroxiredoxin n=1 Tax=Diaphorina citri TaxID=121845 RepID=A0A1S3DJM4_DIACI|nr:peroxiredoxin-2-like isoform X2 [Diaphorina citri]KAI5752607.1 hypothetical protein M8J77_018560 [Diaphorina citri]